MSELLNKAIDVVKQSENAFCRYITANDVGKTGSHQSGFYIPKDSWSLFFDEPGRRGENMSRMISICWNEDVVTESRAIYYGLGTRNEYRLTRFGRDFPLIEEKYSGSLIVIAKISEDEYSAFILEEDTDIDDFLSFFNTYPSEHKHLIDISSYTPERRLAIIFDDILKNNPEFPTTEVMSQLARYSRLNAFGLDSDMALKNPDKALVEWIETEYQLFKAFENREFGHGPNGYFPNCQSLIDYASSLLNRRKSRAGKSLEHHLSYIFTLKNIMFEAQVATEGKKNADFIFPDGISYHNLIFPGDGLTFLGAKTTCKDRWRQVLNEANRIPHKYLFTLQQGISANQLNEMEEENLTLVVPKQNLTSFVHTHRDKILTLDSFIDIVKAKQIKYCV